MLGLSLLVIPLAVAAVPDTTTGTMVDTGNRLVYLDEPCDPYYVGLKTAKLVTPQWVGDPGVQAVVVLANDDMREPARHEAYIRPIVERLKQSDPDAGVSLMTNRLTVDDPIVQRWLREGINIETHTAQHRCPCLSKSDFARAKKSYDDCIELLRSVPNAQAVAFRMPCCDSMNSVSPRFFAEIFNRTTPKGEFLTIDSSVFMLFTINDPALPRPLVLQNDGWERFRKYVPTDRNMANLIEDYPYPYVISRLCWEVPCLMPSDWDAQNLNGKCSPKTVDDLKAAIDAVVLKQGIFSLCYHTHGWIENRQVIEMIDHAFQKHGKKVKFLSFRQVQERLNKNLLGGQPLRAPDGQDNGVRILDINNDGYLDVVISNRSVRQTRLWSPKTGQWQIVPASADFPLLVDAAPLSANASATAQTTKDAGVRFGVLQPNGHASLVVRSEKASGVWHFEGKGWHHDRKGLDGFDIDGPVPTSRKGCDTGVRLRDLDLDGVCELIVGNPAQQGVFRWSAKLHTWQRLPFSLPKETTIVDTTGRDAGFRFVDFDEDGYDDIVFSNAAGYSAHIFTSIAEGWTRTTLKGKRDEKAQLPMIVRADGTNNGAWFKYRHMWVQNEDTGGTLPGEVQSLYFTDVFLAAEKEPPARSPQSELRSLIPRRGFKVELMACEPVVMDCIDIAWGPDGRVWVVEMADYPMGIDDRGTPGGRVRLLYDDDGDGRYERSTVFLEPIGFPTGIMPWRNGALLTTAPNVYYVEDTDGDGVCDVRKTLLSGFHEGNQQHRVNHPRWGLDNWVYMANGDSDGKVLSLKTGKTLDISGRDVRFQPDDGSLETTSGRAQYGRNRDDWGNWFGCNNNTPAWHYVLEDHYLRRNPHLAAPRIRFEVTEMRDVYPAGRVMTHCYYDQPTPPKGHPGRWTSVAGVMIYRDDLFGPLFAGNLFVEDSVYNVVHRLIMQPQGIVMLGHRAVDEELSEFLASVDPWFRPASMKTGPDGALWVTDMYRYVIEHPQWIDDRLEKTLELRRGHDRGRIFRVYPVDKKPRPIPRLDKLDTAGLVAALDSPSGWQRDMAQQMLLWRADRSAVKPLEAMVASNPRPLARLHALCALEGLGALSAPVAATALADKHPGVRRNAVRVSEPLLDKHPELGEKLLGLADDPDAFVQLQLAYSLGEWHDPRAGRLLGKLAVRYAEDQQRIAAVLSSAPGHLDEMIAEAKKAESQDELVARLTKLKEDIAEHPELKPGAAPLVETETEQPGDGTINRETSPERQAALDKYSPALTMDGDPVRGKKVFVDATCSICHRLEEVGENIGPDIKTLVDRSPQNIIVAIIDPNRAVKERFVEYAAMTVDGDLFQGMLTDQSSNSVTLADGEGKKHNILRRDLEHLAPTGRSYMGEGLEARLTLQQMSDLLAFVNKAGPPRRRFPGNRPTTLLAAKDHSLELPASGAEIYGPKITYDQKTGSVGSWTNAEAYVVWGLHLGRRLEFDVWVEWSCAEEAAGNPFLIEVQSQTITGKVPSTSSWGNYQWTKVGQMKLAAGAHRLGFRSDGAIKGSLAELRMIKLTPPGAPLVAEAVRRVASKDAIKPQPDGSLRLTAENGKPHGPNIKYMPKWKAFGDFMAKDNVTWEIDGYEPGYYQVWLEWSVDDKNAGKPWALYVGGRQLLGTVGRSGGWETYRKMDIGRIMLIEGPQELLFRRNGRFTGPLLSLRGITLVPVKDKP